jgi:CheY-like chemotaxis protein
VTDRQPIAILAVDDEPGVLALVRRCVVDDTHVTLTEASSGKHAIEHVINGASFDLLIADLRMPEVEGDEMARQIRLDKSFTKQGLRPALALLLFGRTSFSGFPRFCSRTLLLAARAMPTSRIHRATVAPLALLARLIPEDPIPA